MKKLLIILTSLLSVSCVTQKRCSEKFPITSSKDSIYIETIKEVPYYIEGDSILIEVPSDCDDIDPIIVENSRLRQVISILNGKLTSKTDIKPDTVIIPVKEIKEVIKEVKVSDPVKFVPKIYKIFTWIGVSSIISLLLFLFIKIQS